MIPKASPQYRSDDLRTIENNAPETPKNYWQENL